jgi:hypothetical protein
MHALDIEATAMIIQRRSRRSETYWLAAWPAIKL